MAADCMTRAWALAIATAACVGLPCALVYEIVRAAAARRSGAGAGAALSVFLVVWVAATAAYYPRVCADILRLRGQQAGYGRHFDYPGAAAAAHGALLPRFVAPSRQQDRGGSMSMAAVHRELPEYVRSGARVVAGDGDDTMLAAAAASCDLRRDGALVPPLFVARHHGGMAALPREPPATRGGGARVVVAGDTVASCAAEPSSSERCAVCLCDVDKVETAARLKACLHMFHRQCIDQWLHKHGHTTCPICRSDAFAAAGAANGVTYLCS